MSLSFRVRVKKQAKTECRKQTSRPKIFLPADVETYKIVFGDPNQNFRTVVFRSEFGVHCSTEHHTLLESLETVYGEEPCPYNEEKLILS